MLDLSKKRQQRRRFTLPSAVKILFLLIPWAFIAYGMSMSKEFFYFHNNSVPTNGTVVFYEPSHRPLTSDKLDALSAGETNWGLPSFMYVHQNGEIYVGGPIADASRWNYRLGDVVPISYNRAAPGQAQPTSFFKFWWGPAIFVIGGFLAFVAIALAFNLAAYGDHLSNPFDFRRKQRLNLRRK